MLKGYAGTKAQKNSYSDLVVVGVTVSELSFTDGSAPAQDIVDKWLCLVNKVTHDDPMMIP